MMGRYKSRESKKASLSVFLLCPCKIEKYICRVRSGDGIDGVYACVCLHRDWEISPGS